MYDACLSGLWLGGLLNLSFLSYFFRLVCYAHACLSGLWLGGLLNLSFLSYFFKLVCYAHVFPCMTI